MLLSKPLLPGVSCDPLLQHIWGTHIVLLHISFFVLLHILYYYTYENISKVAMLPGVSCDPLLQHIYGDILCQGPLALFYVTLVAPSDDLDAATSLKHALVTCCK